MKQATFLRDLRNYLVHYGVAPMVLTVALGGTDDPSTTDHAIKLNAHHLLQWRGWKSSARAYLWEFDEGDGPVIIDDVVGYANAMKERMAGCLNSGRRLSR